MEALARLCQTYWYPLYAYVRLRGHSPEEAKELTHEFFSRLLQNKTLAYMKRDCGKFRSFLVVGHEPFPGGRGAQRPAGQAGDARRLCR
jgi:DNA-directed RNA polymerase specialized sigma24 family protein